MVQYNLIRNGYFTSLTTSGTGNVDLSWAQLESLMDGNLTSSGVTLTGSDTLYLEADLSQRIKVDGIRLYASDLTKSSNINFYYKNAEGDSFTSLSTSVSSYYYTTISDPSAPRYIRVTISGVNMELYEFQIFNDDYIVAFGEDGSTYAEYITDTPIGEEGIPQAVAIYNNGDSDIPADAYITIDYTGNTGDDYLKISSSENGTYYAIEDGALLESNELDDEYLWDMGEFTNTEVSNDEIIVSGNTTVRLSSTIPLVSYDRISAACKNLHYDPDRNKIYLASRDGTPLKLYEYDYNNDTWSYISELKAGASHDLYVTTSCYLNDYVYVMSKIDGSIFFRYNLDGPQDNYEDLPSPPTFSGGFSANANEDRLSMCTDGSKYIYIATCDHAQYTAGRNFMRYDTTTSGWDVLSDQYISFYWTSGGGSNTFVCQSMTYDADRDRIYMLSISETQNNQTVWIQRYFINTDTWDNYWLTTAGFEVGSWDWFDIFYYDNYLYCGPNYTNTAFYRYDLTTDTWESFELGYRYNQSVYRNHEGFHILAIDPIGENFEHSVLFGNIDGDLTKLILYNMPTATGTYTTPIFKIDNQYESSYFVIDGDTSSGTGNISYDPDVYNGTIRVKSSDTAPLTRDEIYWGIEVPSDGVYIRKGIIYNGNFNNLISVGNNFWTPKFVAVDRRTGYIYFAYTYYQNWTYKWGGIYLYDNDGNTLYTAGGGIAYNEDNIVNFEIDKFGNAWYYLGTAKTLYHTDVVNNSTLYSLNDGTDFLYDLAVEMDGTGVWYTDQLFDLVIHKNSAGTTLDTIVLTEPRAICGTLDSGCWVIDNTDEKAYRYNSDAELISIVNLGRTATRMTADMNNGFWYISGNYVYHVNSGGTEDVSMEFNQPNRVKGGYNGCAVWSSVNDWVKYIDNDGNVTRSFVAGVSETACPALFSFRYNDFKEFKDDSDLLPASYDPVWGTGGSLAWREVRKDGYFLPKYRYHQAEITLHGLAILEKVIMAPAVKVQDIPKQNYKYMYIKSNIPEGADISQYESRLKAWWGVEE